MARLLFPLSCVALIASALATENILDCDDGVCFAPYASSFRSRNSQSDLRSAIEKMVRSTFRADTAERIQSIMSEMRSTYKALPKTASGFLGIEATRHLLHRHFVRTHAWVVRGVAPNGKQWDNTAMLELLRETAPSGVIDLFEQRLEGRGLDLREVALLAAMLANQVHSDTIDRLRLAIAALGYSNQTALSLKEGKLVLDAYMMSYIYFGGIDYLTQDKVHEALKGIPSFYPEWPKMQKWVHASLARSMPTDGVDVPFEALERTVVDVSEHYGTFQAKDCDNLKALLMEGETLPGRIPVGAFYGKTVSGEAFQFYESIDYMRYVGVLEEINGTMPSVIIANYIDSPMQLVSSSKNFAVSCLDECEPILARLEEELAESESSPTKIANIVANMSTSTQPARHAGLSASLLRQLKDIERVNGGSIPLHGRLLALFLHHAFPRECPYPHGAGFSVDPMIPADYDTMMGYESASVEPKEKQHKWYAEYKELKKQLNASMAKADSEDSQALLPWDTEESLLAPRVQRKHFFGIMAAFLQLLTGFSLLTLLLPNIAMFKWLVDVIYALMPQRKRQTLPQ